MSIIIPVISEFNDKGVKGGIDSLKKLGKQQLATAVTGGALVDLARRSIQAANKDAESQQILARALKNTTAATDYQISVVEKNLQALQYQSGVADDDLRPALTRLVGATKNAAKAQELLTTALDIAAFTGKDLDSVATSLSKAYNGNVSSLKRLGLSVTDSTVKSKDFNQAMREIRPVVDGASDAANKGALGGWKKLRIAVDDLSEAVGTELNDKLSGTVTLLGKLVTASAQSEQKNNLLGKTFKFLGDVITIGPAAAAANLTESLKGAREELDKTGNSAEASAAKFRMFEETSMRAYNDELAKRAAAYNATLAKQRKAAAEAAKANKEKLATALQTVKNQYEQAKAAAQAYSDGLSGQITGMVSLSDAVSASQDSEQAYTDAVKERAAAYEELNKLKGKIKPELGMTADQAEQLADALGKVKDAEAAVQEAQNKRTDYSAQFKAQIEAAKNFSVNLQRLVAMGLNDTGIQQLINLGPVAGNQVAKDLVAGTGGLTVQDVNLTDLQQFGGALGSYAAEQMFGYQTGAALSQVKQVQAAQTINVTVTSADPDKVVEALVRWSKRNGALPAVVKTTP